ncbi:MAG: hypothetical protein JNM79_25875 [Burkholderiales bacterium]|nr:hypothetical protein [Burkholderiales bacterium]
MSYASRLCLLALLASTTTVFAQEKPPPTLMDSYVRVSALKNFMAGHVGELLLGCAEKNVFTQKEAEARYQAYRKRNAALFDRADAWGKEAEARFQAQGEERVARRLAEDADLTAMAAASARAQAMIDRFQDVRASCTALATAIETGRYDVSVNAEFVALISTKP